MRLRFISNFLFLSNKTKSSHSNSSQTQPAPAPAGSAAPMTVMSETALSTEIDFAAKEVTRLKADINAMEQKQQELSSANRLHQAASEELRSKAENVASTLPLYAVVVLWLVFFYIGLTLDKYYSVE